MKRGKKDFAIRINYRFSKFIKDSFKVRLKIANLTRLDEGRYDIAALK
jgi:hypothetical protein